MNERNYMIEYPSEDGITRLHLELEGDVPLRQLVPDILALIRRSDGIPSPDIEVTGGEALDQTGYALFFQLSEHKQREQVSASDFDKTLGEFEHPEFTVMIIEPSDGISGSPVIKRVVRPGQPVSGRRPAATRKQVSTVAQPKPKPKPPIDRDELMRRDSIRKLYDQFINDHNHFKGMVDSISDLTFKGREGRFTFWLRKVQCNVEDRTGNLSKKEEHPIIVMFPERYPGKPYEFWYDISAASGVVAYQPNVSSQRGQDGSETPGYICLYDYDAMRGRAVRLPIRRSVAQVVRMFSYESKAVNLNPPHRYLNEHASRAFERGELPPLENPRLPVPPMEDDDHEIKTQLTIHQAS